MKRLLLSILLLCFGCNQSGQDSSTFPPLTIRTSTVIGGDRNDVLSSVSTDYFDVSLTQTVDRDKGFMATKKVREPEPGKQFHAIFFYIVDSSGENQYFKTSTDFLNFMSDRGYDVANQAATKYGADYTFKRKH